MAALQHQNLAASRQDSAYLQGGGFSQAKQRRKQRLVDQHGRKYFAVIEIRSGDPVGPIEPMFQSPLTVPAMYLRKHPDIERPNELLIDYPRWIGDLQSAHEERTKRGRELARKTLGSAYDPAKPLPSEIEDILGPAPQPVEPVYAAMQGNRWILGYSTRVDLKLVKFFEPEQLNPRRALDLSKYDFRDNDAEEGRYAEPEDEADVVSGTIAPRVASGEFDYEEAAAGIDDGMDDLEMQLDADDDLEAQFDRNATGGQRVPVGNPPKGTAPKAVRSPSTKHPGDDDGKERPAGAKGRGKAKGRAKAEQDAANASPPDLPPAA